MFCLSTTVFCLKIIIETVHLTIERIIKANSSKNNLKLRYWNSTERAVRSERNIFSLKSNNLK